MHEPCGGAGLGVSHTDSEAVTLFPAYCCHANVFQTSGTDVLLRLAPPYNLGGGPARLRPDNVRIEEALRCLPPASSSHVMDMGARPLKGYILITTWGNRIVPVNSEGRSRDFGALRLAERVPQSVQPQSRGRTTAR